MTRRPVWVMICLAGVAGVASACAGSVPSGLIKGPPPGAVLPTTTTIVPDLSTATLAGVSGSTTTVVGIGGGAASLSGTVAGPTGPVPGAQVHVERITAAGVAAADAVSAADGSWQLAGIQGGRYRVRAWRAPDLDLVSPNIFFLGGNEAKVLNLQLSSFTGTMVTAAVNPAPASGDPFNLAVVVTTGTVDTAGIARSNPVQFTKVELTTSGDQTISTTNPAYTDAAGRAEWEIVCNTPGPQTMSVIVNDTDTLPLNVPACGAPSTTTTGGGGSTTTVTSRPTTTTSPH